MGTGGLASAAAAASRARSQVGPVRPRDVPWLLLLPAIAIAAPAIALLAAPLGAALIPPAALDYWETYAIVEKSATQAGYLLTVVAAVAFALAVAWAVLRPLRLDAEASRVIVVATQAIAAGFVVTCWIVQHDVRSLGVGRVYFTPATLLAAAALTALIALGARGAGRVQTSVAGTGSAGVLDALVVGVREVLRDLSPVALRRTCLALAALATVVWLLPSIYGDRGVAAGPDEIFVANGFVFDEALAVLDGRSPLVDMATYGSIWPYLIALPFGALDGSFAAFTTLMTLITGAALLAVHGVLRRVVASPLAALALYLPFLATSLFVQHGDAVARYDPGNYFGIFPLRYAGPYLLALLVAQRIARRATGEAGAAGAAGTARGGGDAARVAAGARGRRDTAGAVALFAVAGLVACNNVDFGVSALAASVLALLVASPPRSRAELLRLTGTVAAGLAVAAALVCALTLARTGSLPQATWLLRYGRVFTSGGWGNLALPGFGLHLVISATFVAALATAAVRAAVAWRDGDAAGVDRRADASDEPQPTSDPAASGPTVDPTAGTATRHRVLTGMLAWTGLFGLGASVYYYAYRSHPDVLINLFSVWALALALLAVVAVRALRDDPRPSLPALAVVFGFGLCACSLAQLPLPWSEVQRIARDTGTEPFRDAAITARVDELTAPGEPVLLFHTLGHRIAYETGADNISPYTGLTQMPAREQLHESFALLAREGGSRILLAEEPWVGMRAELARAGFVRQPRAGPGDPVVVYVRTAAR